MGSVVKRVLLFLVLNAAIIITISLVLNLLNVKPYLTEAGLDYQSLLAFCLIWGFVGSFISLGLSRLMAKWVMGVQVIDPDTTHPTERQLLAVVQQLIKRAGLPKMPEVGIYESDEVNAFATGPSRSRALVAVSSGLLKRMEWDEIEGVLGHEVSHIANGDMVTMTLLQGVVNAFVMFLARVLAFAVTRIGKQKDSRESSSPFMYTICVVIFEILFMILGSLVIAAFSRFREYRADAGGARLAGKEEMIKALVRLQTVSSIEDPRAQQTSFQALKISNRHGILRIFATHPPLEDRIARLKSGR
jgi:heat shock protein HtpX